MALVATGLAVPAQALGVVAGAPDPAGEVDGDDLTRPDPVSAMVTARATGEPVEDRSQRTETVRVFAQPDGTWVSDGTTEPERVQREDGTWAEIDTTLERAQGGGIAPVASTSDVVFSAGGDKVFAALTDERGRRLEWRWPTVLPEPAIDGDTATYPDALSGLGDLVVTATSTGFTHNIVIPERPDESAGPVEVEIPVATRGAELVENRGGEIAIETLKGDALVASSRPLMWDSSENEGGDPVVAPVETTIGQTRSGTPTLTLTADESLLNDPETVYPVIIDPSFTINPSGDTWVQTPNYTSSQHASQELKAGTYDGGAHKARSFLRFDNGNAKWAGVNVLNAKLKLRNFYSGSCTGAAIRVNRIIEAWSVTGLTWGNQPSVGAMSADYGKAHGYNSSCDTADATWDMTEIVRGWNGGLVNNGVRVAAVNETSNLTWRRYRSAEVSTASVRPRLIVSYNSYPKKPTTPSLTPGNPGYATSTTPTFKTTVSDPDGGTVRAVFEVYQGSTLKWSGTTGYVSSGAAVSKAITAGILASGTTYTVKVKANDGTNDSKGYSAARTFTVDTTKPTVSLTSSAFTNNQWRTDPPASNTFTFTGSGDTASFAYTLDGVAQPAKAADSTGKATLSWLPKNGAHTLSVTPTDKAGNVGTATTFKFGVGPAAFMTPNLAARSTGVFPVQVSGPPNATGASLSWRYAGSSAWNPAADVQKSGGAWDESVSNTADGTASTTGALTWDAAGEKADPASPDSDKTLSAPALLELRACFTYSGGAPQVCTTARQVQLVPSAFGGSFPVTDLGPATVALFTGEMTLSESDAVDTAAGAGRTFSSYDPSTTEAGAFGPGWSTGLLAEGDTTDLIDHRSLDGTFVLVTAGGASQTFTQDGEPSGGKTRFVPADGEDGSRLVIDAGTTPKTATLTRVQGPVTTWTLDETGASWVLQSAATDAESASDPEVDFEFSAPGYPTFVAETEPGVATTCTPPTQSAGCRALRISYTGSGENKRVSKIERLAHGTPVITLATYGYDSDGRLTRVCDPRVTPQLCTTYTYIAVGGRTLLATATPAGQKPWRFSYDNTGRLTHVKRELDAATGAGDAVWTAVYDLSTSTSGLPSMTATATAEWGQEIVPTKVFATFGPDTVPAANPSSGDLKHASLWYTDEQGTTTNTAVHGAGDWLVDTSWYDERGNVVRELDGAGRARALDADAEDRPDVAYDASSLTFYNSDPDNDALDARRVEDTYGPVHTATLKDGTTGPFRSHTSYTYDDEAPALGGGSKPPLAADRPAFDLVVEERHSAAGADLTDDHDVTIIRNNYAPVVAGDGNGWTLGAPTEVQTKVGSSWATQTTRYDTRGRLVETRRPGGATNSDGAGADAHATVTTYYEPGATDPDCNTTTRGKPNWVGMECKTGPAAQPTGNPIPTTFHANFNADLQPTRVEERSGSTTRVTTSEYDDLGRATSQTVAIGGSGRTTSVDYAPTTGLPATVSEGGSSVTTSYDTWGRTKSYTDATGLVTMTTYTADGLPATSGDPTGTYTYTYDSSSEHRRLPTSIDVGGGISGAFTLTYNAAGDPTTITYPNGLQRTTAYDEIGVPVGLEYTAADDTELLSFSNTTDVDGMVVAAASAASEQDFTYDALGRLTKVEDKRTDGCTTRTYGFDASSNRTGFKSYAPGAEEACQNATPTVTKTSTYDAVGRIRNAGYTYDDLGRTLTTPADDTAPGAAGPLTATYQVNDMVKKLTQSIDDGLGGTNNRETSYELDPQGRINTITSKTDATETDRLRYRFADGSDVPTSIQKSSDAGATWNSTRYVAIPEVGMVASHEAGPQGATWQLSNLHGDIVAGLTSGSGVGSYSEYSEFGYVAGDGEASRYGWLGQHQRSADPGAGLVMMGARLYNSLSGNFASPDAVRDGNVTPYVYPQDPVNYGDLNGYFTRRWSVATFYLALLTRQDVGSAHVVLSKRETRAAIRVGSIIAAVAGLAALRSGPAAPALGVFSTITGAYLTASSELLSLNMCPAVWAHRTRPRLIGMGKMKEKDIWQGKIKIAWSACGR